MDRGAIEAALREALAAAPGFEAAWLFGSLARGTARAESDVDVALWGGGPPTTLEDLRTDLADQLSRLLGREVQLVVLDSAPVDLVHRVLRDGVLLVDRDRAARIRFEVDARNRFFEDGPDLARMPAKGGLAMTDADLVAKKLAFVETCARELCKPRSPRDSPCLDQAGHRAALVLGEQLLSSAREAHGKSLKVRAAASRSGAAQPPGACSAR